MKRLLAVFLTLALLFGCAPLTALAADPTASGKCGTNATWTLDGEGTLTISGTGAMASYTGSTVPWASYRAEIQAVVIESGVTCIGEYAFYKCTSLTSVTIPSSVTKIKIAAFSGCTKLAGIEIPSSVTGISSEAFYNCKSLTSIVIPAGIAAIGTYTFENCAKLTSVTIPASVTNIGKYAFNGCTALADVYYGGTTEQWNAITIGANNAKLLGATLHAADSAEPGDPAVASGKCGTNVTWTLDEMGTRTISGTGAMTSYTGSTVPWAGYRAEIQAVVIENGVTAIGEYAFYKCTSLTGATIPSSVTKIKTAAFSGCTKLQNVTIPDSVTTIGSEAFYNCKAFTSVAIPNNVTSIGAFSFENCSKVKNVVIPVKVTSIGKNAFNGCAVLSDVYYGGTTEQWSAVTIGAKNAPLIGATLHAADSVEPEPTIGGSCGTNVTWTLDEEGVLTISGTGAMTSYTGSTVPWASYRAEIKTVVIESGVTCIGEYAFYKCTSLTSVTIPSSVTKIKTAAFSGCTKLAGIEIPSSVTGISSEAFYNCKSLTSIVIPAGIAAIGTYTFENCAKLTSVTIPASVTNIGKYAFNGCTVLSDVYYGGTTEQWSAITIGAKNAPLTGATLHATSDNSGLKENETPRIPLP